METHNLYQALPASLPAELIETLAGNTSVRIERIVSRGHCSPPGFWYEQNENEWVVVLKGQACLRFERGDRVLLLGAGDYAEIPAGERHRVDWTIDDGSDTIWLAVFYAASARP